MSNRRVILVTSLLEPFSYHPYIYLNPGNISHARKPARLSADDNDPRSTHHSPYSLRIHRGAERAPEEGTGSKGSFRQYRCRPGEVGYVGEEWSETYVQKKNGRGEQIKEMRYRLHIENRPPKSVRLIAETLYCLLLQRLGIVTFGVVVSI